MTELIDRLMTGVPSALTDSFRFVFSAKRMHDTPPAARTRGRSPYAALSIESLLEEVSPLPAGSILVGACEDQQHFFMDLHDPSPGSVLIAADRKQGPSRLLHSILSSALLVNSHRHLRFAYLSPDPTAAAHLSRQPHCYKALTDRASEAGALITHFADLAESRANTHPAQPFLILAIDGLDAISPQLDDRSYDDLAWLLQYGPSVNVWPFVTMDVRNLERVGEEMIALFGTHILGSMSRQTAALFQADPAIMDHLVSDKQFCVWFDGRWQSFWAPEPLSFSQHSQYIQ